MIKEFRLWAKQRSLDEISIWRYRQIDPRNLGSSLLNYLNFDEGSFAEYNFIMGNDTSLTTYQNVDYIKEGNLVICPLGTYFSADQSRCYQDPIT